MYFLNAFERHLPIFWISISENPHESAVVAAPIRKLRLVPLQIQIAKS